MFRPKFVTKIINFIIKNQDSEFTDFKRCNSKIQNIII